MLFIENQLYVKHCDWHFKNSLLDHQPRLDAWDKRSDLVHWEDLEGSGGEGSGRGDRDGEHM